MSSNRSIEEQAGDPHSNPEDLRRLAVDYPQVRPIVAGNPAASAALLSWLKASGDPQVLQALASRNAPEPGDANGSQSISIEETTDPGEAATQVNALPVVLETQIFSADLVEPDVVTDQTREFAAGEFETAGIAAPVDDSVGGPTELPVVGQMNGSAGDAVGVPASANVVRRSIVPSASKIVLPVSAPRTEAPAQAQAGRPVPVAPPAPPAAFEAQPYHSSAATPKPGTSKGMIAAVIVLAILAVVSFGTTIYLLTRNGGLTGPGNIPFLADDTDQGDAESEEIMFPAPEGSVEESWFVSPTGNIACEIGDTSASCTIFENYYDSNGFPACGTGPATIKVNEDGVKLTCITVPIDPAGAPELDYDEASTVGNFACLSTDMGMNCWNTVTGDSFIMARAGWTSGTTGQIPYEQIPWD